MLPPMGDRETSVERLVGRHSVTIGLLIVTGIATLLAWGVHGMESLHLALTVSAAIAVVLAVGRFLDPLMEPRRRWEAMIRSARIPRSMSPELLLTVRNKEVMTLFCTPISNDRIRRDLASHLALHLGWEETTVTNTRRPTWAVWMPRQVMRVECRMQPVLNPQLSPMVPPRPPRRGRVPIGIGRDAKTGEALLHDFASVPGHMAVVGASRSGKSNFAYTLLAQVAPLPWVRITGIDPTAMLLGPIVERRHEPICSDASGADVPRYIQVLEEIVDEMHRRIRQLSELGTDQMGPNEICEENPLIFVVLEEYPGIHRRCVRYDRTHGLKGEHRMAVRFESLLTEILEESAKVAIRLVLIAQQVKADILPTDARGQFGLGIAFRTEESMSIPMILGDVTTEQKSEIMHFKPGQAMVKRPGHEYRSIETDFVGSYSRFQKAMSG